MTQFKDKTGKDKEKASVGLYIYPNLMAADILLYKATHVPVGADQSTRNYQEILLKSLIITKRFLSFTRTFNSKKYFVLSFRDGTKKMSKSEESDYSRINLKDSSDEIVKNKKSKNDADPITEKFKIMKIGPRHNLLSIYSDLSDQKIETTINNL